MGFLSKLFGFGGSKPTAKQEIEPIEYNGFLIYPDPIAEGGNTASLVRSRKKLMVSYKSTVLFVRMFYLRKPMPVN